MMRVLDVAMGAGFPGKRLLLLLVLVAAMTAGACSTSPVPTSPRVASAPRPADRDAGASSEDHNRRAERPRKSPARAGWESLSPDASTRLAVVAGAIDQLGAPYRYAGAEPSGFDCSGFVDFLFEAQGVGVPRTAQTQSQTGRWVALDETRPGDLVFFALGGEKISHVGVIVSEPGAPLEMVHSATSRGVVRTRVDRSKYWLARLKFARSYLD